MNLTVGQWALASHPPPPPPKLWLPVFYLMTYKAAELSIPVKSAPEFKFIKNLKNSTRCLKITEPCFFFLNSPALFLLISAHFQLSC